MRFMLIVKGDRTTEAGVPPTARDLEVMGKFNEELIRAGVLLDATGLQPTSKGAKVTFPNGKAQVTDGPFAETKEIIGGYWLIKANSKAEAIEWASRVPHEHLPHTGRVPEIEVRQLYEIEDFADAPAAVVEQETSFTRSRLK